MNANSTSATTRELPRRLGLVTSVAVVVGIIIGSGIFRVPSPIAAEAGSITGIAIVWIAGGLVALFGALSVAELAAMYPRAGGLYVYLLEAWGRPLGFLTGWMYLITTPISWAAQSLIFAEYLGFFVPLSQLEVHGVAAALIALVATAQYRSVGLGAAIQNLSTGTKLIAIIGLSVVIFVFAPGGEANPLAHEAFGSANWAGIGIGFLAVLWAYDGWENLLTLSGEIRKPGRNLPLALIGGVLVVIVVYLLINAAYLRALPLPTLASSTSVATDSAAAVLGRVGTSFVGALVMLSTFGSLNGSVLSDPRVFYAMAEDGLFFRSVGRIHRRFETPYIAIVFITVIGIIYVLLRDFLQLAEAYVLGIWPFLALAVIGLFVLRRKRPDVPRPYRALGYPVIPALFVLATIAVIANSFYRQPEPTAISAGLTLIGIPLYFLWLWWQRRTEGTGPPDRPAG
ncbi:MAG: APC family permease [Gammaproteobacteria bacterium]